MIVKIFIGSETYPHILSPLTYLSLVITNTHKKVISRIEIIDVTGEPQRSIDCRDMPQHFEKLLFRVDWLPEVVVDSEVSYVYESQTGKWVKLIKQHTDAAFKINS
jgi:hypothetical protein